MAMLIVNQAHVNELPPYHEYITAAGPHPHQAWSNTANQPPPYQPPPPYPTSSQHQFQYPGMHPACGGCPPPRGSYYTHPPPPPPPPQQQQQQQQQQQVVVISQNATVVPVHQVESFCAQIVCSCLVLWFCNFVFGLIGFILAMVASNSAAVDPKSANQLGKASWGVSVSGMLLAILITAILVGISTNSTESGSSGSDSGSSSCSSYYNYYYLGTCYKYKNCYATYSDCYYLATYLTSYAYDSYNGCCYYN